MSLQSLTSQSCQTLADWLNYIEQSHPIDKISLGLERVQHVASRGDLATLPGKIVLIAGTNGKGTTARALEQLLLVQGYTVGVYSSPHLIRFNERLRINNQDVADADWVEAFCSVESLRQGMPLTYFEFTTLVAFAILRQRQPDFCIIEVGLGGRLDATNIVSPDISVVTTIDLDHQAWLGNDRESIGREKAGVFRRGKVAVSGDLLPPRSLVTVASDIGALLYQVNQDFHYTQTATEWSWHGQSQQFENLPLPTVPVQNVATALAVLEQLGYLPHIAQLHQTLAQLQLIGRMQWLQHRPSIILDVAHNPQSASYLAAQIHRIKPNYRRIIALVGMLKDKDITQSLQPLVSCVDQWCLVSLEGTRGASSGLLANALQQVAVGPAPVTVIQYDTVHHAYHSVKSTLQRDDLFVIFGSFVTVAAVLALQQEV